MNKISKYFFDVIVIGAGGAGLRTALELIKSKYKVACLSKVFPTRSHTVSAQGGIAASLGNKHQDNWRWHMYDTVKGSDYLGDQNCIEYMCKIAPKIIYELEHMGLPFSRIENGLIYQRAFGGMSREYNPKKIAQRTCAAADRTGHALLHTLYQANIKEKCNFFNEWYAIDLVKSNSKKISGVIAINIKNGEIAFFESYITVLATGGSGRIFESTTNAYINTGDGLGMVLRANLPLQDMEFWQFHPTGIAGVGCLITEGCRGEGGILRNNYGERFMERYAPNSKDLACRDVVSRSSMIEIQEGRGAKTNGINHVWLDLTHLGKNVISQRLPGIREISKTFAHVDPVYSNIPVVPTCHYMMGGIPTNIYGQAITIQKNNEIIVQGLYAVGECACVSVHGANRLGSNSLLDLIVFGRSAGKHITKVLKEGLFHDKVSKSNIDNSVFRLYQWNSFKKKGENIFLIRNEMKKIMQENFGVFRTGISMNNGIKKLQILKERLKYSSLEDQSKYFNTMRIEALELDNLLAVSIATAYSANYRTESRGSHSREDYPKTDNKNWIKHSLYFLNTDLMKKRSVNMHPKESKGFKPESRIY